MSTLSVPVALDADGFLPRECSTCRREFRWLPTGDTPTSDARYCCPYCGARNQPDQFFTQEQVNHLTALAERELVKELRAHGFEAEGAPAMPLLPPVEPMQRIDFACHPGEPVKVYEEWVGKQPVHCLICGASQ